jgi:hypothetical protein
LELALRYSYLNLNNHNRPRVSPLVTGGVFGGRATGYAIGVNWYPTTNVRFVLDYIHDDVNKLPVAAGRAARSRAGPASSRWRSEAKWRSYRRFIAIPPGESVLAGRIGGRFGEKGSWPTQRMKPGSLKNSPLSPTLRRIHSRSRCGTPGIVRWVISDAFNAPMLQPAR